MNQIITKVNGFGDKTVLLATANTFVKGDKVHHVEYFTGNPVLIVTNVIPAGFRGLTAPLFQVEWPDGWRTHYNGKQLIPA